MFPDYTRTRHTLLLASIFLTSIWFPQYQIIAFTLYTLNQLYQSYYQISPPPLLKISNAQSEFWKKIFNSSTPQQTASNTVSFSGMGRTTRDSLSSKITTHLNTLILKYRHWIPLYRQKIKGCHHIRLGWEPFGFSAAFSKHYLSLSIKALLHSRITLSYPMVAACVSILVLILFTNPLTSFMTTYALLLSYDSPHKKADFHLMDPLSNPPLPYYRSLHYLPQLLICRLMLPSGFKFLPDSIILATSLCMMDSCPKAPNQKEQPTAHSRLLHQ